MYNIIREFNNLFEIFKFSNLIGLQYDLNLIRINSLKIDHSCGIVDNTTWNVKIFTKNFTTNIIKIVKTFVLV